MKPGFIPHPRPVESCRRPGLDSSNHIRVGKRSATHHASLLLVGRAPLTYQTNLHFRISRWRPGTKMDVPAGRVDVVGPALEPALRLVRSVVVFEVGPDRMDDELAVAALED